MAFLFSIASVPAERNLETIRLYPENGAYGGRYYIVEVALALPVELLREWR